MKKLLTLLFLVAFVVFAGCTGKKEEKVNTVRNEKLDQILSLVTGKQDAVVANRGNVVLPGIYVISADGATAKYYPLDLLTAMGAGEQKEKYEELATYVGNNAYEFYIVYGGNSITDTDALAGKTFADGVDANTTVTLERIVLNQSTGIQQKADGTIVTQYNYTLTLSIINNGIDAANPKLPADGETIMSLQAVLKDEAGLTASAFRGQAIFESQYQLKAAQENSSFDKGVAAFNVKMPNSSVNIIDEVNVKISFAENMDKVVGLKSNVINVVYEGTSAGGGPITDTTRTYVLSMVKSADVADRVKLYVSGIQDGDFEAVKTAIKTQVRIYNNETGLYPIQIVDIVEQTAAAALVDSANKTYVFTALLKLPAYNAAGYSYDVTDVAGNNMFLMRDNGYNYWQVFAGGANVRLQRSDIVEGTKINKFMLIDGTKPVAGAVEASQTDRTWLGSNTLLAVFSESMERISSETPNNWILNGHVLEATDVRAIKVLDLRNESTVDNQKYLDYTAVKNVIQNNLGKERSCVIIELTSATARRYLVTGQNLLQARTMADWAGVTDNLTNNNKITTQDFLFTYDTPVAKAGILIDYDVLPQYRDAEGKATKKESPEQFIVKIVDGPLYADEETKIEIGLDDTAVTNAGLRVTIEGYGLTKLTLTRNVDYRIVKLAGEEDGTYILELMKDWTKILGDTVYHGKTLTVELTNDVYDIFAAKLNPAAKSSLVLEEDTKSPIINIGTDGMKSYTFVNAKPGTVVAETTTGREMYWTAVYSDDINEGEMVITMDEPCQFLTLVGTPAAVVSWIAPAVTPSDKQKDEFGVPVPTFEYVKVSGGMTPAGYKVDGTFVNSGDWNEHDWTYRVIPTKDLDKGTWKLVVRSIADDVGNTMSTEQITFIIDEDPIVIIDKEDTIVDPYVIWSYAKDDVTDATGTNDYIYILYSRQMEVDAIRAATYSINGQTLGTDANITQKPYILFRRNLDLANANYGYFWGENLGQTGELPQDRYWRGQLVTIKLPQGFLNGDNMVGGNGWTNALVLPLTLKAQNDTIDATKEALQFGNNNGSNVYELLFDEKRDDNGKNYFGINGIYEPTNGTKLVVPPVHYTPNAQFQTAQTYENWLRAGVTPADKVAADAATLVDTVIVGANADLNTVTANLVLPATIGSYSSNVSWSSSNTTVISTNGTVTRPANGAGNATVTLTATIINGTASQSKTFTVVVLEQEAATVTLVSIAVTTMPTKIVYTEGETLALGGLVVTATMSDATTKVVTTTATKSPAAGTTLSAVGTQTVTVTYTEGGVTRTTSFNVTVNAAVVIDKTALNAAVAAADAKVEAEYTAASWTEFQADLTAAKALPETTQAEVDAKTAAVNAAVAKLVAVATDTANVTVALGSLSSFKNITVNSTTVTGAAKFKTNIGTGVKNIGETLTIMTNDATVTLSIMDASDVVLATATLDVAAASGPADITLN